ncbi:hypothetical protein, partial [Micromonospora sp. 4G55]|uniref:hypothetical protein n=1 Tax=Micromonospora sp. 4G55 TaxID=2806102 RepID=UPI001EE4A682
MTARTAWSHWAVASRDSASISRSSSWGRPTQPTPKTISWTARRWMLASSSARCCRMLRAQVRVCRSSRSDQSPASASGTTATRPWAPGSTGGCRLPRRSPSSAAQPTRARRRPGCSARCTGNQR